MYFALGTAAAGALDLLSSLAPSKSGAAKTGSTAQSLFSTGSTVAPAPATPPSGVARSGTLATCTFNALIGSQDSTRRSDALKDLFGQLDVDGDGKVTQSEFADRLGAGGSNVAAADKVFTKLDADADGSVTIDELGSALKGRGHAAAARYHLTAQLGQPAAGTAANAAQSSVSVTA
jgi:hypothetical protein